MKLKRTHVLVNLDNSFNFQQLIWRFVYLFI